MHRKGKQYNACITNRGKICAKQRQSRKHTGFIRLLVLPPPPPSLKKKKKRIKNKEKKTVVSSLPLCLLFSSLCFRLVRSFNLSTVYVYKQYFRFRSFRDLIVVRSGSILANVIDQSKGPKKLKHAAKTGFK